MYNYLMLGSLPRQIALSWSSKTSMKLTVISNFFRLSQPSMFSILEMLLRARLRYYSYLSLLRFSIFSIMLFCKYNIFRCLQSTSKFSILTIYCWCKDTSSSVVRHPLLCSDLFLKSYSVIRDMDCLKFKKL